jgi:hypothetical protein
MLIKNMKLANKLPITVAVQSEAWTVFAYFQHRYHGFESRWRHGRLCAFFLCLCSMCRQRSCDRLIRKTEKEAKAQQKVFTA